MSLPPDAWQPGLRERLRALYEDLHRRPELSRDEHRTARKAAQALTETGYEVTEGVGGTGAESMIHDGLFERFPRPDIMLGQYVGPLPAGVIGHRSGPVMAAADSANVKRYGRGGHGSRPEATVDLVLLAASIVVRLQGVVAREAPPHETAVVTVGRLPAGTTSYRAITPPGSPQWWSQRSAQEWWRRWW